MMYTACPDCGKPVPSWESYCPHCGADVRRAARNRERRVARAKASPRFTIGMGRILGHLRSV